jgi:hypothetical protein
MTACAWPILPGDVFAIAGRVASLLDPSIHAEPIEYEVRKSIAIDVQKLPLRDDAALDDRGAIEDFDLMRSCHWQRFRVLIGACYKRQRAVG